ncbi:DUF859 family phage minor structural protein [Heyndrickxia faecalis]|uniref:DUF859 family phage minor structural protein n=1 Tax=Heyndrickxia faecalis TaxID=2824910 RepID=UPI0032B167F8
MALSGSFSKGVSSHWRVRCTWSGKQSISGNYTDITLKVYWESTDGYGTTYTSATKDGSSTVNGNKDTFTFSARLNGKDSNLVHTQTERVYHNSDGTKTVTLSASLGIELTLNGTYYGTVSCSDTVTLNTIPRASSLSSSASWTAGNGLSISISRASSDFKHTAKIYVNGTLIKTITGIGSSTTASFSTSENTAIFNQLNGAATQDTKIEILTYDGGDYIGTTSKTGTVTAPSASDVSAINGLVGSDKDGYNQNVYIDQSITIGIKRANSGFTHTVVISCGSFSKTFTNVGTSFTWTPSASEQSSLYAQTPNSNSVSGNIRVTTYYNGERVRNYTDSGIKFYVRNSNPTFSPSNISYADVDNTMTSITGNNQIIVQNLSSLTAYVNTAATAINGATLSKYVVTIDGKQGTISSATGSVNIGKITSASSTTLSITAIDSRGNSTTVTKTVTVIPYTAPTVALKAVRKNGFENTIRLDIGGMFSPININGANKNSMQSVTYSYAESSTGAYGAETSVAFTTSGGNFSAKTNVDLDNTKGFDFQVVVKDKFNTVTAYVSVDKGQPIFFIDSKNSSIGFNDFPQNPNEFRVNGRIVFGSTKWATQGQGEGAGALDLNNSDIVRANGIFMSDVANDNNAEGLLFLKSGKTSGSTNKDDYDNLYMRDGKLYTNGSSTVNLDSLIVGSGGITFTGTSSSLYFDKYSNLKTPSEAASGAVWHIDDKNGKQAFAVPVGAEDDIRIYNRNLTIDKWMNSNNIAIGYHTFKVMDGASLIFVDKDGSYSFAPKAKGWSTPSRAELKQDFQHVDAEKMLELIENTDVLQYRYKVDVENGRDDVVTGFVIGGGFKTPKEFINYDQDGIDSYRVTGVLAGAVQALSNKNKELTSKLKDLQAQNEQLNARLDAIEERLAKLEGGA